MTPRVSFALGVVVVLACGGKTVGSGTETDGGTTGDGGGSGGGPDGASSPDVLTEASPKREAGGGGTCNQGPGSRSSGQGACEIQLSETCSDGTTYQVDCSCPSGTCSCSEMSGMSGSGGGGIPFAGCPSCPSVVQAYEACGFPH